MRTPSTDKIGPVEETSDENIEEVEEEEEEEEEQQQQLAEAEEEEEEEEPTLCRKCCFSCSIT